MRFGRSLVLLAALVLAGCGGATKTAQHGHVRVFFCTTVSMPDCRADATRAEELAVGRALRNSPHVVKLVYVSKAEALQKFRKMNPTLPTRLLPANPLPAEWVVTVDSDDNTPTVGKAICAAHYAGVERCARPGEIGGVGWNVVTRRLRFPLHG